MEKMKKKKVRSKDSFIFLLNPKYLQKEVHAYGYNFSEKMHIGMIGCVILGSVSIGLLFQLRIPLIILICMLGIIALPAMVLDMYKRMYQQKRFEETGDYMERVIVAFQKEKKIYSALKDCSNEFEEGKMKESIREAMEKMDNSGSASEALDVITSNFQCQKMRSTNEFLVNAEKHSGEQEFMESSNILIKDNNSWVRRGYSLHAEKKQQFTEILMCIVACTLLCSITLYALNYLGGILSGMNPDAHYNIFHETIIQCTSIGFIVFSMLVCLKGSHKLTGDWLSTSKSESEQMLLNDYAAVNKYDEKKDARKSIILGAPFLIVSVPAYLFFSHFACVLLIAISLFLFFQHKIGYNIALNAIRENLSTELPVWFMDLTLLMQNNTVYVALKKSYDNADIIIQKELEKLFEEMAKKPGEIEPYFNFCKKFQIPEIGSCMKTLYTVAENGTEDNKVELYNLIRSVQDMQIRADKLKNERNAFQYKRFFNYPMAATTIKLGIDCIYGMMLALSFFGSVTTVIGG